MNNNNATLSATPAAGSGFGEAPVRSSGASSFSRPAALIGGATALIALTAIATTLIVRPSMPANADAGAAVAAQTLGSDSRTAQTPADVKAQPAAGDAKDEAKAEGRAPVRAAGHAPADKTHAKAAAERHATPAAEAAEPAAQRAAAPVCASCGVIESVTAFQKKGEASGVGAVAGGVIGGVLGNQVGGGNGKKAMTVLGAVGGGMAGHEIEKRQRATTLYSVKVRMEDGTLRTVTQATPPSVGQKVTLEGTQIKSRA